MCPTNMSFDRVVNIALLVLVLIVYAIAYFLSIGACIGDTFRMQILFPVFLALDLGSLESA